MHRLSLPVIHHNDQEPPSAARTESQRTFAMRKQWETKLLSFRRGLVHVQQCRAGDACGSALCHSTRRLMLTYANHQCSQKERRQTATTTPSITTTTTECKVCKLWDFLVTKPTPVTSIRNNNIAISTTPPISRVAHANNRPCRVLARRSSIEIFNRVMTAQNEDHSMSRRF